MTLVELMRRARVDLVTGCWHWLGAKSALGYGTLLVHGRTQYVHRLAFVASGRVIPRGRVLDHLCRHRDCFNPAHVEPVTQRTNVLRGEGVAARHAKKTHCDNGHELAGDNLIILNERGWRACRACRRVRHDRAAQRKKVAAQ